MLPPVATGGVAFALVYFTFFLDNVLLTVLVPIMPDWVRGGEALSLWAEQSRDAPIQQMLNGSRLLQAREGSQGSEGGAQAAVGLVLGAKATAQLLAAAPAANAVSRLGPAAVLRCSTLLLMAAALAFLCCASLTGWRAALLLAVARFGHGAAAAGAGVAGLTLAARHVPKKWLGALLGAVALGVLVGYLCGGVAEALWSRGAPFVLLAAVLFFNFVLQCMFLDKPEYNERSEASHNSGWLREAKGAAGASAGAVLLTTSVMATLEPCVPLWVEHRFHPQRWVAGAVFVPDSVGYLLAASLLGGVAARVGSERVALMGVVGVGIGALWLPLAPSLAWLAAPHALLGASLGATDAALLPALLARRPNRAAATAALLQAAGSAAYALGPALGGLSSCALGFGTAMRTLAAAGSAAYALGPALGGLLSWALGFGTAMRTLAVANLLYAAFLYRALSRHPLSLQWGASADFEDSSDEDSVRSPCAPFGVHAPPPPPSQPQRPELNERAPLWALH